MKKSDASIHSICIAAIKRALMDTAQLNFTHIYEDDSHSFPFDIDLQSQEIRYSKKC